MPKLENIAQTYQLVLRNVARVYAPVQRFNGNPWYPKDVKNLYVHHVSAVEEAIKQFDLNRRVCLKQSSDPVLTKFDSNEARQLALVRYAPKSFGELNILPSYIETNEEKNTFYEKLKGKIARFVFTFAVIEVMASQIGQARPIFSNLAKHMQDKALRMSYEDFTNYLVNDFFKEYREPIDYIKNYMEKTGEGDLLRLANYELVEEIVDRELMSRYRQLEQYETPEAALVNLLDSILSDDEFIIRAQEGVKANQVERSIHGVGSEEGGKEFIESVAMREQIRCDKIPPQVKGNSFFNGTIEELRRATLAKYSEATGICVE